MFSFLFLASKALTWSISTFWSKAPPFNHTQKKDHPLLTLKRKSDSSGENILGEIPKDDPRTMSASRRGKAHECTRKQLCRKGHRVLMNKWNICQQCAPAGKATNQMWVCINEIVVSRSRSGSSPSAQWLKTTAEYSSAVHGSEINPLDVQKQA